MVKSKADMRIEIIDLNAINVGRIIGIVFGTYYSLFLVWARRSFSQKLFGGVA